MIYRDTISVEKVRRKVRERASLTSDAVGYFSRAWEVVQQNAGSYIAFTLVFLGISFGLSFVGEITKEFSLAISSIFDIISNLLNIVIFPGYYIFTYKLLHKKHPEFNDFLGGFQYIGQLILQAIVMGFFYLLILVPVGLLGFVFMDFNGFEADPSGGMLAVMVLLIFVVFFLFLLLFISWLFAPMLIIFSRVGIWEAMESSRKIAYNNIGTIIILFILQIIASLLAVLTCCIGFLWLLPVMYVSYYLMFDDLFELDKEIDETDLIIDHLL